MRDGTDAEQTKLILGLHKRLYHQQAPDMRRMLRRAGMPLHALAGIEAAIQQCDTCRAWAKGGTKPIFKNKFSPRFNHVVLLDLIYFDRYMVMIAVDEALRYTILALVNYKSYESLEQSVRREWIKLFGPMRVIKCDRESAFAGEQFGVWCERYGIQRILINVSIGQHTELGALDRRVQLVRTILPRLAEDLAADHLVCEPEDSIAETQFALNSQMQYEGFSPHECLLGCNPHPLVDDESEFVSQHSDSSHGFYEHQIIRSRAIAVFHQAMLHQGMTKAVKGRTRTNQQALFKPGDWVDIFRKPTNKNLMGWRGPAVVIALLGEGHVTCRWQSVFFDMPINLIRPHQTTTANASLESTGPAPMLEDKKPEPDAPKTPMHLRKQSLHC
jgi:hypothetical protein